MPSFDRAVLPASPPAAGGVSRAAEERAGDRLLVRLRGASTTRYVVIAAHPAGRTDVLTAPGGEVLHGPEVAAVLETGALAVVALGELTGADTAGVIALVLPAEAAQETPRAGLAWVPGRSAFADAVDAGDGGVLAALTHAQAMAAWHASHRFSPETGRPTGTAHSGWVRVDPVTGTELFPRTDPAVIVALVDEEDRIILGRAAGWPETRYSTLAGFVEPGETPEEAVVRELREEVGVRVDRVRYLGSQSWPFPRSLMLGFIATTSSPPVADGTEIVSARAFSRAELEEAVADGSVTLPGTASISRALIRAWHEAEETR
ncbi:NAD(+) diphosphatase [Falsarthrobacter nasiphocae]|uniref:NAD(+) diphosphatase n=1 Tax=Falsarthrobacter nasiphocae TaxID=189863 RepID=A0AAE3YGD9_9MICC|nr:NAD(+) diphosphatase [Falsarthrobacter nasiphocae]MDR6891448.1 NAD+ diphosphatase [Falsarthrobacter nasiphocae]